MALLWSGCGITGESLRNLKTVIEHIVIGSIHTDIAVFMLVSYTEGDHMSNSRVEKAVRDVKRRSKNSRFKLNKTLAFESQMTVRYSADFLLMQPMSRTK